MQISVTISVRNFDPGFRSGISVRDFGPGFRSGFSVQLYRWNFLTEFSEIIFRPEFWAELLERMREMRPPIFHFYIILDFSSHNLRACSGWSKRVESLECKTSCFNLGIQSETPSVLLKNIWSCTCCRFFVLIIT